MDSISHACTIMLSTSLVAVCTPSTILYHIPNKPQFHHLERELCFCSPRLSPIEYQLRPPASGC